MRLTSRQSISPWRVTRRVLRHRSEQQATRRSSRRHRRSTVCAAVPHPSTKLPPRKTARSDALTIEMSALEARPPTAPESWLLSGISSPPWVRSRHTSHPTSQAGSARDSAPDTARAQTPYPTLGVVRLSRKFFRKLRYGRERPKVDESCGRGSSLGLQFCTGEQNFAFPGSKKSQFLEKSRSARARKPNPYLKNQ